MFKWHYNYLFMVKTTINLDDEIYTEIVKDSVEKYGSTRNISKIINQLLKENMGDIKKPVKRISFKVKEEFASLDADNSIKKIWGGNEI